MSAAHTASWLRDLAAHVDYSQFRKLWLHPVTEQAEHGFIAACYEKVAQRANSEGEYFLAFDAATHGLRAAAAGEFPPHRLVAAKVTALARSGATGEAQRVLDEFLALHEPDGSVCSAQARMFRDRGLAAARPEDRRRLLAEAARWAARAKDLAKAEGADWAYPANQEAQFRFLAGDRDAARASALAVIDFVEQRAGADSMWDQTNLAEMHLLRGESDQAHTHYQRAAELGRDAPGDLAANRAVAALLLEELSRHQPVDRAELDSWFPKPVLVAFTGHIPDAPNRVAPRLPEALCRPGGPVAQVLKAHLQCSGAVEGIAAGAPGGDILFAEAILALGARFTLVEPFPPARVEQIAHSHGGDWPERLSRVYGAATRSEPIACAESADEAAQCEYANHVMLGLAMLRAKRVHGDLRVLALWDESEANPPARGGTAEFVALCRQAGVPVEIINPNTILA